MHPYETLNEYGKIIKIYPDEDAENPRDWDNLGTMICFHRRYQLGDKHTFQTPADFDEWRNKENPEDYLAIILPLYLLDHSGLRMSVSSFHDHWDSGQVGWIYVTKEKVKEA